MRRALRRLALLLAVTGGGAGCGAEAAPLASPDAVSSDRTPPEPAPTDLAPPDALSSDRALADQAAAEAPRLDLTPADSAAPDLKVAALPAPDLAAPDLAPPDLAPPDLAPPDLAVADLAVADLAIVDRGAGERPLDAAAASCLPRRTANLRDLVMAAPYASANGMAQMKTFAVGSAPFRAARDAALAWSRGDCPGFAAAAMAMGYRAEEITDSATQRRHWLLTDASAAYNGVFVLRAPDERPGARPLVIDSPHFGFDFQDDRAVVAYRALDAVALLQNTAHRCNRKECSNCSPVSSYACGGCVVVSDVVHSTEQLYFALYDGLEEARDDLHFEYHGAAQSANAMGCAGTAHVSQASSQKLAALDDDNTFPGRFWRALEARLGAGCVCYHQRETGCLLNGYASTAGRRTNSEAAMPRPDECTSASPALARRFVHLEQYNVPVADLIAALTVALP